MTLAVNDQSKEVRALAGEWTTLEALQAGTSAMRAQGKSLLPQWPAEESDAYQSRLATATLFPAYRRTVSVMAGKPFAKALTLADADTRVEAWAEDVDLQGVNLHGFAASMFEESFYGLAGILVEYPVVGPSPQGVRTVAAVEREGLRPYFVRVMHSQILGWRLGKAGNRTVLTQLRLKEDTEVEDGEYGTKTVERVRVLRPGSWELWEKGTTTNVWALIDYGTTTLRQIPFVPVYGRRTGFMCGAPPLLDLAYLNVKHWQSQSDQDTILHVARVPMLAVIGADQQFDAEQNPLPFKLVAGASSATLLPKDSDMKFVEHGGAAIQAGEDSLIALRDQMVQTGAELLVKRESGDVSATEAGNDAEANKCDLQRMAEQFEDALDQALVFMAEYAAIPPGRAGSVSLFKDFGAATLSDASAQLVADLNSRGLLSKETTLREMQRRGVIEASVDVEEEIAKAAEEGPALGELGGEPVE